jgi:hypothetical protein
MKNVTNITIIGNGGRDMYTLFPLPISCYMNISFFNISMDIINLQAFEHILNINNLTFLLVSRVDLDDSHDSQDINNTTTTTTTTTISDDQFIVIIQIKQGPFIILFNIHQVSLLQSHHFLFYKSSMIVHTNELLNKQTTTTTVVVVLISGPVFLFPCCLYSYVVVVVIIIIIDNILI